MLLKLIIAFAALGTAACTTLADQPPVYGCAGIPEFCPDQPPAPDGP
jgi:hypothetical protein